LLRLARARRLQDFITRHGVLRGFGWRFVAGETLEDAIDVVGSLNAGGVLATLDYLGEEVADPEGPRRASRSTCGCWTGSRRLASPRPVLLKLTQLGLAVEDQLAEANVRLILQRAQRLRNFVRIDMEGSACTQRTLDLFHRFRP